MKRLQAFLAAGVVLAGLASPAMATDWTVSKTFDLNNASINASVAGLIVNGAVAMPVLTVQAGDTIKYSVSFAAGQSVTIQFVNSLSAILNGSSSGSAPFQSGNLLVKNGANVLYDLSLSSSAGNGNLGVGYQYPEGGSAAPFDSTTFTLTGLEWDGTFNTAGTYNIANFMISSDDGFVTIPPAPGVPEPASWAMMIGGFGMIGAAARRSRRLATA